MGLEEVKNIAAKCVHYGMCKIDFLGAGVCPSGIRHKYVSYYPQGGMEIVNALANNLIPVTERLVDIANACTLCGICDKQCYFVTGLRPTKVMKALKEHVEDIVKRNEPIERPAEDRVLRDLRRVVGEEWATNDPAILVTYSIDTFPLSPRRMPTHVVMPESTQEVAAVVKVANRHKVPFVPRGTGQNTFGVALGQGIIIDLSRMKRLEVDPENWTVTVGAGVTSFEMQKEANKHKMRASVAEPAACVCANQVLSGIHSVFIHSYGWAGDNYIDAEIVAPDGETFRTQDKDSPNIYNYVLPPLGEMPSSPGICTQLTVKLYPIMGDEEGILVPFSHLHEALKMMREVARRRIGLVASVLGLEYYGPFVSPTSNASDELTRVFTEKLDVNYLLMVVGDRYAVKAIKEMADVTIDQEMVRTIMLGLPKLYGDESAELISQFSGVEKPYKLMFREESRPLVEMSLSPSPDNIAAAVDKDLREFFRKLYSKPEMTDLVWLNMYRILSSRMGRGEAFVAVIVMLNLNELERIVEICETMKSIGDKHNLRSGLGVINPLDFGKRALMEYDYYFDHTSAKEVEKARNAFIEANQRIGALIHGIKGMRFCMLVFGQGLCRNQELLYTTR